LEQTAQLEWRQIIIPFAGITGLNPDRNLNFFFESFDQIHFFMFILSVVFMLERPFENIYATK